MTKISIYATLIMPNQLNIKRGEFSFFREWLFLLYSNQGFDKNANPFDLSALFALYIELVWRLSGFAFFVRLLRWSHFLFLGGEQDEPVLSVFELCF